MPLFPRLIIKLRRQHPHSTAAKTTDAQPYDHGTRRSDDSDPEPQSPSPLSIVELLHCIFDVIVLDTVQERQDESEANNPDLGIRAGHKRLLELSSVSRSWREAVLQSGLWALLYSPCVNPQFFRILHARAKQRSSLHMFVDRDVKLGVEDIVAVKEDMARVKKFSLVLSKQSNVTRLLDILRQPIPAVASLTLSQTATFLPENFPESVQMQCPHLRHLKLFNIWLLPTTCYARLTTVHVESSATKCIPPEVVDSLLALFCSNEFRGPLISLSLIGIGCKLNNGLSHKDRTLPASLRRFHYRGDLKSCEWLRSYSFPEGCSMNVEVTWLPNSFPSAAESMKGVSIWMWKQIHGKGLLKRINIATFKNYDDSSLIYIVRHATETVSHSLTVSCPSYGCAVFKNILPGLPETSDDVQHKPSIGPHTWLELDVVAEEAALRDYGSALHQYLEELGNIQRIHIPHFKTRFSEFFGKPGNTSQATVLNPYEAIGVISSPEMAAPTSSSTLPLLPSLAVVQLSHLNPGRPIEGCIARFLYQRSGANTQAWSVRKVKGNGDMPIPRGSLQHATLERVNDHGGDAPRQGMEMLQYYRTIDRRLDYVLSPCAEFKTRS